MHKLSGINRWDAVVELTKLLAALLLFSGTALAVVPEICGDGIDNGTSSGTKGSCPSGYVDALVGDGCDLLCVSTVDRDRDGYNSDGTEGSYGTGTDCDDTSRLIYPGVYRACGTDGTQVCQTDGTWSTCAEGALCEATGSGTCYYVDCDSGSDPTGDGSYSSPWQTPQKKSYWYSGAPTGHSNASAGDVIYIMGSTCDDYYDINGGHGNAWFALRARTGTASEPITIKAYPGHSPVVDPGFDSITPGIPLYYQASTYVVTEGLEVVGGYKQSVFYKSQLEQRHVAEQYHQWPLSLPSYR